MPVPLPPAHPGRRYLMATETADERPEASLAEALGAFADDLLESGDARLTLERAFRWGYRQEDGTAVEGLQEQLQELRSRRDRLRRQAADDEFLEALSQDLDRLDAQAGAEPDDGTALDRLAERLDAGYDDAETQLAFDQMVASLREMAGADAASHDPAAAPDNESFFQPTGGRDGRVSQVRRMLFGGGMDASGSAAGSWRVEEVERRRSLLLDLRALAELDDLERSLGVLESIGSVSALDAATLARAASVLPEETAAWLSSWAGAAAQLTRPDRDTSAGLPPEVISALGRHLLRSFLTAAAAPVSGEHETRLAGTAGDVAEATRPWEPGAPLDLDLIATLTNAIRRGERAGAGRIALRPDDFVVAERTQRSAVSTVLAIDRSRSMGQSGAWTAARKVTLAMHELIRQSYPRDSLSVVAFSSEAEAIGIEALPEMPWDRFEHGTHLQAALALARRMLRRSPAGTKQVVVITDGEPTRGRIGGEDVFASPPTPEVLEATMREVIRCTRERITITLVLVGGEDRLESFAEQVARVNRGRVMVAQADSLGAVIVRDYLRE